MRSRKPKKHEGTRNQIQQEEEVTPRNQTLLNQQLTNKKSKVLKWEIIKKINVYREKESDQEPKSDTLEKNNSQDWKLDTTKTRNQKWIKETSSDVKESEKPDKWRYKKKQMMKQGTMNQQIKN